MGHVSTLSPRRWFTRLRDASQRHPALRLTWKIAVGVIGGLLIVVGVVTGPILPGPQSVIVLAGLVLLASEFPWARKLLRKMQAVGFRAWRYCFGRSPRWAWRLKKKLAHRMSHFKQKQTEAAT